jgi:WhiB family transcriptional regulator, redox-sensing transcriptional regulator
MPSGRTRRVSMALAAALPNLPDAACRDYPDPDLWHPPRPDPFQEMEAIQICMRCPETGACLAFARKAHPITGIWGGTTFADRSDLFRRVFV